MFEITGRRKWKISLRGRVTHYESQPEEKQSFIYMEA